MPDYQPIDYRLRCHTKRTDLPSDVLRDIGEAYAEIERLRNELDTRISMCDMRSEKIIELTNERDGARRELCAAKRVMCRDEATIRLQRHRVHRDSEDVVGLAKEIAVERGWDCFKDNP